MPPTTMPRTARAAAPGTPSPAPGWWRAVPVALLLVLATAQVHGQWVWRDKDGRINASDRPPPREVTDKDIVSRPQTELRRAQQAAAAAVAASAASAPATTLPATATGTPPLAGASSPGVPRGPVDRDLETRRRAAEQEQAARAKAEEERQAAQRAENCRRARSHAAALDSGQRIARLNDKGEREFLDDRGRADELRQARGTIASDCR